MTLQRLTERQPAMTLLRRFVLILGIGCPFYQSHADDWPQWRGPLRTGHVLPGIRIPTHLPPAPKIIWRIPVGDGFASPVVAAGKLFHFDNQSGKETLHALKADDAKELWKTNIDDTFQDEQGPQVHAVHLSSMVIAFMCNPEKVSWHA